MVNPFVVKITVGLLMNANDVIDNNNKYWRGVWNKALSDFWCNVKFS